MNLQINSGAHGCGWVIIENDSNKPVKGQTTCTIVADSDNETTIEVEFVTCPGNKPTPVYIDLETGYLFLDGEKLSGQYDQAGKVQDFIRGEQVGIVCGYFHIDNVVLSG